MTKYTDNEQYEKDKAKLIEYCESPMAKLGYHSQQRIGEIAKLLKQSKWIGAYPTEHDITVAKFVAYAEGYEDCKAGYSDETKDFDND